MSGGGSVLCLFGGFLMGFGGWHSSGVCGYGG